MLSRKTNFSLQQFSTSKKLRIVQVIIVLSGVLCVRILIKVFVSQFSYGLLLILYHYTSNIWQVFSNSRATHVQPPTVALIVQNKIKRKKRIFSVSDRPENFISFCFKHIFSFFLTYCAVIKFFSIKKVKISAQ